MNPIPKAIAGSLPAGSRVALGPGFFTLEGGQADLLLAVDGSAIPRFVTRLPHGCLLPPRIGQMAAVTIKPHGAVRLVPVASAEAAALWLAALENALGHAALLPNDGDGTSTPEALIARSEILIERLIGRIGTADRALARRTSGRAQIQQARFGDTLDGFGLLLKGRFRRAEHRVETAPLAVAAQALARALKIKSPAVPEIAADTTLEYLERFASANRLRLRRIDKSGGLPNGERGILAFDAQGKPLVLAPRHRGGFYVEDASSSGRVQRLSDRAWDDLSPDLFTFHRILPDEKRTVASLLSFGLVDLVPDMAIMAAFAVVGSLLALLPPILSAEIANIGVHSGDLIFLGEIIAVLGVALIAEFVFNLVRQLLDLRFQGQASLVLHAAMVDRLLRIPAEALRGSTTLILATQMETIDKLRRSILSFAAIGFMALANGLTAAILVATTSTTAGGVAIALVFSLAAGTALMGWLQFKAIYEGERMDVIVLAFVYDLIRLVPTIRASRAEKTAFAQWGQNFLAFQTRIMRSTRIANRLAIFEGGWEIATLAASFAAVALAGASGKLDAGQAIVFVLALSRLLHAGKDLSHAILGASKLMPMAKLAKSLVEHRVEPVASGGASLKLSGRLDMRDVHFAYSGKMVLNDVTVAVEPGEFIGVMGPSGSGKSTLLRMLLGLERPQSGLVTLDGHDIAKLDRRQTARQIGVVMQGAQLFPGTILDNIRGVSDIDRDAAWHFAELAGLADELRALPMGLHTYVGESGNSLAAGQVQRLMIARALAQQPSILVLDEAMSVLDAGSQTCILNALAKLDMTRIVVSHRPSVILRTDRAIVVERGRIVDDGRAADVVLRQSFFSNAA